MGGMSKTFRSWDVDQRLLLPPSVEELIPAGHLVHFIRDTVRESLDLSAILEAYTEERGYPPYHPVMMTALLLYAYCQGVYSSRRIERACEERIDFRAITAHQTPDFRTIAEFRKRHLPALGALFGQVLALCQEAGLVKLGHVALDGTKIQANASKHKAMSYGRMKKVAPELAAEVAKWFAEAETTDDAEDAEYGADRRGDELPEWVASKVQRLAKMQAAMAALEAAAQAAAGGAAPAEAAGEKSGDDAGPPQDGEGGGPVEARAVPDDKAQRNFTDPDSRIMKTADGFEQAYNAQAAVDAASQVIVGAELTNAANDKQQVEPMVAEVERQTGRRPRELSADSGYCSESNLGRLDEWGIRGYVATGRQKHGQASATGSRTGGPQTGAMAQRLKRGGHRSRYRLRKQTVEPVFGQIKGARGFRQFVLRGLEQVRQEWRMVCTAHNLLKLAGAR